MSIFGSIMEKIFHHPSAEVGDPSASLGTAAASPAPAQIPPSTTSTDAPVATPAAPVDVGAVLAAIAGEKGGGGNYEVSIVDLLKLLSLDSSLDARKRLAQELDVHAGADGSAEQNTALHRAVVQKLAQNGGKIPAEMRS